MIDFDPLAPAMAVDPYPHYRRLREQDPVHRSALGFWMLTRHADVTAFFREPNLQHCYELTQTMRSGPTVAEERYFALFRLMVFVLDNPDHRRIRQLFTRAFTPARVREMEPRVTAIAADLLDAVECRGAMELVADFAKPFPIRVIGDLLGIPAPDHERIGALADELSPALEFLPMSLEVLAQANQATAELVEYFGHLAAQRRNEPGTDLLSALVHASDDDGRLSDDEVVANAVLMYIAGHETTAGATGLAVLALHRNADQLARLVGDPALIPNAVEELLRYDSPGQATARVAVAPVTLNDVEIPQGTGVVAYMGAANRDPAVYADPDRLDLTRAVAGPTSFGGGAHFCLGHALARQELHVALTALLGRFPELRLDTLDPPFRPTALMRGVAELPCHW